MVSVIAYLFDMFVKRNFAGKDTTSIVTTAGPGLMTLLDTALYRTYEGQLTATICSANALLHAWFELKKQARGLLQDCCRATLINACPAHNSNPKQQKEHQAAFAKLHAVETFATYCLDCCNEAITLLTSDKISSTANISPSTAGSSNENEESVDGHHVHGEKSFFRDVDVLSGVITSHRHTWEEIGPRLTPYEQHNMRKKDRWECTKLYCPDYVWADDAHAQCHRLVRALVKNATAIQSHNATNDNDDDNEHSNKDALAGFTKKQQIIKYFNNIMILLRQTFPMRLTQFKRGLECDVVVSKRLYLIKNEYRAPFRAFLEGHEYVQRAPKLSLVTEYIRLHKWDIRGLKERRKLANQKIQDCLMNPALTQAIKIEEQCEKLEVGMATMILPFAELARVLLDGRVVVQLVEVPGVLEGMDVLLVQELLKRMRYILCRKTSISASTSSTHPGTLSSTGIRPLLLDLQGMRCDPATAIRALDPLALKKHEHRRLHSGKDLVDLRLPKFCKQLQCIYDLGKSNRLGVEKKEVDGLSSAIRSCAGFDGERFSTLYKEWYDLSHKQQQLSMGRLCPDGTSSTSSSTKSTTKPKPTSLEDLSEEIRKAEIEVSIAMASSQALTVVQQRIEQIEKDRLKRFEILQEMVEECCLREMDLNIQLVAPDQDCVLELPQLRSVQGIFDPALQIASDDYY